MTVKKTKAHENAIYAINNNLKRLKKYYKEVAQTGNFNKYIKYHKDYIGLKNKFENIPKESIHYKELRELHDSFTDIWFTRDDYKFPNLYHYAIEDVRKLIMTETQKVYDTLPSYQFDVTESEMGIYSNGIKIFKTSDRMRSAFHGYDYTDSTAKIIFEGVTYYPHDRNDCNIIFNKLEEIEALQEN